MYIESQFEFVTNKMKNLQYKLHNIIFSSLKKNLFS